MEEYPIEKIYIMKVRNKEYLALLENRDGSRLKFFNSGKIISSSDLMKENCVWIRQLAGKNNHGLPPTKYHYMIEHSTEKSTWYECILTTDKKIDKYEFEHAYPRINCFHSSYDRIEYEYDYDRNPIIDDIKKCIPREIPCSVDYYNHYNPNNIYLYDYDSGCTDDANILSDSDERKLARTAKREAKRDMKNALKKYKSDFNGAKSTLPSIAFSESNYITKDDISGIINWLKSQDQEMSHVPLHDDSCLEF